MFVFDKDIGVRTVLLSLNDDLFDFPEIPKLFPDIVFYILFRILNKTNFYFSVDVGDEEFATSRNFVLVALGIGGAPMLMSSFVGAAPPAISGDAPFPAFSFGGGTMVIVFGLILGAVVLSPARTSAILCHKNKK